MKISKSFSPQMIILIVNKYPFNYLFPNQNFFNTFIDGVVQWKIVIFLLTYCFFFRTIFKKFKKKQTKSITYQQFASQKVYAFEK